MDKYKEKRLRSQPFRGLIKPYVSKKSYKLINECGNFLMFLADRTLENKKLNTGEFCKNRFCPMCAWRQARRDALKIAVLMEHLKLEENMQMIFLTLTTPNVSGDNLNDEINHFNKAFKKLMQRREVKRLVQGYIRKLEVTYDSKFFITPDLYKRKKKYYDYRNLGIGDKNPTYDTYNPHFHVCIAVPREYSRNSKTIEYITDKKWLEMWREACDDPSITQVKVQYIKTGRAEESKEMFELAKYTAKDSDYLLSPEIFKIFYEALKGKQLIVYSGLFKEALKLYEAGELDVYKPKDMIEYIYMLHYEWCKSNGDTYKEILKRELTKEEYEKYNKCKIEELNMD